MQIAQQIYIFYVVMKQPRSSSYLNGKQLHKKPLLPSFRQPKVSAKVHELSANNKSQLFFNVKLIPLQVMLERKLGDQIKILISSGQVSIIESHKTYKSQFSIPSSSDPNKEWIELYFGEAYDHARLKKIGDQNLVNYAGALFSWDKLENIDKKSLATINVKQIIKPQHKKLETIHPNFFTQKDDKNKQMKAFVANLMLKKQGRRVTQKIQLQPKLRTKKISGMLKNQLCFKEDQQQNKQELGNKNYPSTACSITNGISGIRSFRKDIIDINKLKQSKFTGKSQKQTSIGGDCKADQNSFLINQLQCKASTISGIDEGNLSKRRSKFDSQPYFYQNNTVKSLLANDNCSMDKFPNRSRQEMNHQQAQFQIIPRNNTEDIGDCLKNKSEYKSEDQVEQDIKRSQALEQSLAQGTFEDKNKRSQKIQKNEESSACVESRELGQSEGTIYQSKYE